MGASSDETPPEGAGTTPEGVLSTLDDLLKSAGAGDIQQQLDALTKGGIVNSGVFTEGKQQGGGQTSETGGIDKLMIAKMVEAGIPEATASEFAAYMKAKADEDDDEEDDDDTGYMKGKKYHKSESGSEPDPGDESLFKSDHLEQLLDEETIRDAVDAAPFMSALTHAVADSMDQLAKSMGAAHKQHTDFQKKSARAIAALGLQLHKSQAVVDELGRRLGVVEAQPMPAKGARTLTGAKALQKSAADGEQGGESLSKSEVASVLTYMNLRKGITDIDGARTSDIVAGVESVGIDRRHLQAVQDWLASHPSEAEAAKRF